MHLGWGRRSLILVATLNYVQPKSEPAVDIHPGISQLGAMLQFKMSQPIIKNK